ncbi:fatty acid synthase [Helicoverpa armigera]|uniref:fatty acid synthase n=1 Tax=Helicoverpa armigera TaxID=29058 RepID=UPI003082D185
MTPSPQEPVIEEKNVFAPTMDAVDALDGERIVISGMAGLYPDSESVKDFSEILYNKVNPSSEEGLRFKFNHPEVVQHSGSVPGLSYFDAQFFKVHYRLANSMDPMARKVLEQSYQAIYDAGVNPDDLFGKKIGVYIGSCFSEAEKTCFYEASTRTFNISGCSKTMFANRISYWLNAKGPSMTIDEACCSSTAALEQAYLAMSRGECEAAIVGGAFLCLHPQSSVHFGRIINLCQDGKTKSFDENADGCTKSEAINVLFLQKAKDALRIYADVLHVKSEFTGLLPGETGPRYGFYRDVDKTKNFIKTFYEEAKVPAQAVEYVEAFGCALPEVDKIELQVIEEVFCKDREDPLLVGSVMSNVGYNESASGITAITKVLLGYHYGKLAANLHCGSPRQDVATLRDGRIRVVTEHEGFSRSLVAVNGLSVTGVNSHVLLNGHYKPKDPTRYKSSIPYLVTISGRHEAAVKFVLDNLKANPIDPEQLRLFHNAHQSKTAGHLGRGFTILQTDEEQKTVSLREQAEYFDDARRPLWFLYSGMGSQWAGMGTQLMRIPIFAAAIERCRKVLEPKGLDIVDIITSTDEKTFDNILHSFVGIAAIQIGLTDILRELGLVPDGIIGHSVGELGCSYADGCLTTEEMILSAYSRGLVSLETPFIRGSMAAIGLGYEQISPMCPPEIQVACHNGPESSTISGPADKMREFVAELTAKGIFAKEVPCSNIAYHSRYIADAGPKLLKYLSEVIKDPKPRSERWLSTSVPEEKWDEPQAKLCSAEYHTNNLLSPVLFEETSRLIPNNAVLVEVAPHGLLQAILKRSLPSCKNIALTRRKHNDNAFLVLEAIGKLYMEGYNPKVHVLYPKVELPVSTGTPFLSHLVKWAYVEKWSMPIYNSTNRTTAASCNYVTSLQDDDNAYLQGHVMRGQTLFPYAATLVLVWDVFCMTAGKPKKQLSVEFTDLHLISQPILHDQRQLRLNLSLQRGTGRFEVLNEDSRVVSGGIKIFDTEKSKPNYDSDTTLNIELTQDDIYRLLSERDYSYSGEFRSIEGCDSALSAAALAWRDNWVTFLDGLLQLNMLRQPHRAVTLPTHIRSISIDVHQHAKCVKQSAVSDFKVSLKADVSDQYYNTKCGGVIIHNIKYEKLPLLKNKEMVLKSLNFIPFKTEIDASVSLEVHLQIVAENLSKTNLNVVGIVNEPSNESIFIEIDNALKNISSLNIKYSEISLASAIKQQANLEMKDVDLVLVQNLSTDDELCQLLHHTLQRDQFIVSEEDTFGGRARPSSLYRVVSAHRTGRDGKKQQSQLQLSRWGAATPVATTTTTVRSQADIPYLISTRDNLAAGHRLLIIAPYPSLPGLKELVSGWRKQDNGNKIQMIMVGKESIDSFYCSDVPDVELAYNVVYNNQWGGEYYTSLVDSAPVSNVTLQCNQFGDFDSLSWVEAPENNDPGVKVKVHYAGISYNDIKKASGALSFGQNVINDYGMDFSGTTESGARVMGLVRGGAASSVVRAQSQLLWPVPVHWSLEDAATVPLAYAHAFYCLGIKLYKTSYMHKLCKKLQPHTTVLVHGGAGTLGQAVLSIVLAHGCQVYTTVSDIKKKRFLLKLFPGLKAEHIGNSRDVSFQDMVLHGTKGEGCDIIISSVKRDLTKVSLCCLASNGVFFDVSQLHNQEDDFQFGLFNLTKRRTYSTVDFTTIFESDNKDIKALQRMISEGIRAGYVRPLSRVTYAPHEAARAFRLLAASRHRGRVLLRMHEQLPPAQPRLKCSADGCHLIISNDETFGLMLGDRLVQRGAKKLCLHFKNKSLNYLQLKLRSWQKLGVKVEVMSNELSKESDISAVVSNAQRLGPVEGVYVTLADNQQHIDETKLNTLDLVSRKLCKDIKYFAILNTGTNTIGKDVILRRVHNNLPATMLSMPEINLESNNEVVLYRGAVDLTEKALRGIQHVLLASTVSEQQTSLIQKIVALAGTPIKQTLDKNTTLEELGVFNDKIQEISQYLKLNYNIVFDENKIPFLTVEKIQQIENSITKPAFKDVKGLSTFFTYVDADELVATTDFVCLPSLVNNSSMREDEFDASQTYLCIVPGMEGHHERFRLLCERLKLPAIVLQPGLDHPRETMQETAKRFVDVLLKKTQLQNNFYLLGYETGIAIALEMVALLEDRGLTGTLYCIGFAPDELKVELDEQLSEFAHEEELQNSVARHMFTLMAGGDARGLGGLQAARTWAQKVELCVRTLLGRVPHSAQYARALLETALSRIQRARAHVPRVRALRSRLVLLRAAAARPQPPARALQHHSQLPVVVHQLTSPLAHATADLQCAAVINRYLHPDILQHFDNKNICDTYLLNPGSVSMSLDGPDQ